MPGIELLPLSGDAGPAAAEVLPFGGDTVEELLLFGDAGDEFR